MTARVLQFPARPPAQLTSEQIVERAAALLRDPARAERSAALSRRYVEHAIKTLDSSAEGTPESRAEACEALRDGLALMTLGLAHVLEIDAKGGAR
jgi:hypothetical protein